MKKQGALDMKKTGKVSCMRILETEQMQKWITPKTVAVFMTFLYVASLIPLFVIAKYNYPGADDYSIGETCRHAWVETHSVFAVIWQAAVMAWEDFFHWMGYFSSIFMMSIHPGVFGEEAYVVTTYIMVGMLSFGSIYLMRALFVKAMKMDPYVVHSITMFMLFVTVQRMVGANEALYWYCGAVNYTFMHGVSLFFYGAVLSMFFDQSVKKRTFDRIIACICGFVAGAGNYMTALNICIILMTTFLVLGFLLWREKQIDNGRIVIGEKQERIAAAELTQVFKRLLLPGGFFMTAFLLSCFAPGNSYRAEGATGMNPIKAIFISFYYALDDCLGEWTGWVTIVLIIFVAVLFYHGAGKTKFRFPCPLLVVIYSYCVLSAMITPPLFAVSNIVAGRLQALIYIMYILLLTIDVCYVTGWVKCHVAKTAICEEERPDGKFGRNTCYAIGTCVVFLFFGSVLCMIPEPEYYAFSSAITDLADGSAKAYGEARKARMAVLYDDSVQGEIVFEKLPAEPKLLYFSDITTDAESWENKAMARYYHKESIVRKEE